MTRRSLVFAAVLLTLANTGFAQQKDPVGPFAADLRVTSSGLPAEGGWTPGVPSQTRLPTRGLGVEAGATVYLIRARAVALGVGATWMTARGATTAPEADPSSGPGIIPDVTTRVTTLAPQLSLNFGHSLGWSYLSAGLGRTRVESEATATGGTARIPARDSDWVKTLNFGGGARWFLTDHVGVGFDLRWHKVSLLPATATAPGAPRATMMVIGAGIVLK